MRWPDRPFGRSLEAERDRVRDDPTRDHVDDPKALLRALENVIKWGRSALPEEETDPDFPLVHDVTLFDRGWIKIPGLDTGDEDAPAKLTEAGRAKLEELRANPEARTRTP